MAAQNESDESRMPKPIYIRNFPFPNLSLIDTKQVEAALDYMPKDGDIILSSYPKTGTTWTQYIIWAILHKGEALPNLEDMSFNHIPFVDMTGIGPLETLLPPRCCKNHFPYHLMNINRNAKYIYIHRNPMDTLVSFYYFSLSAFERPLEFDAFYEDFITGDIGYGDYFDHVLSFDAHKDNPHLLILCYEDMHKDTSKQVLRIAKFIGEEHYQALLEDEALLQKILDITDFSYMKGNLDTSVSLKGESKGPKTEIPMFRKGIVGDGKTVLSPEKMEKLHKKMLAKMNGTDYVQLWSY